MRLSRTSYLILEIILILIIILGVFILIIRDFKKVSELLYHPYSFFLLFVVILEYIILKGMDRSRIYKLEVERLKKKRRKDMEFHVRVEKQIREIQKYTEDPDAREELKSRLTKILNEFKEF